MDKRLSLSLSDVLPESELIRPSQFSQDGGLSDTRRSLQDDRPSVANKKGHPVSWIRRLASLSETPDISTSQMSLATTPRHSSSTGESSGAGERPMSGEIPAGDQRERHDFEDIPTKTLKATTGLTTSTLTAAAIAAAGGGGGRHSRKISDGFAGKGSTPKTKSRKNIKKAPGPLKPRVPSGFVTLIQPRRKKRRFRYTGPIVVGVSIIVLLIVLLGAITFFVAQLMPQCSDRNAQVCFLGKAHCVLRNGEPLCICDNPSEYFHEASCRHLCGFDSNGSCPSGVCYKNDCFGDVISFMRRLYEERCIEKSVAGKCNFTCDEVTKLVCGHDLRLVPMCKDPGSVDERYRDFECQLNYSARGLTPLPPDVKHDCLNDRLCVAAYKFYPCLGGHVHNGSVQCLECRSANETIRTVAMYGYCVLQKPGCDRAMVELMRTLNTSRAGYSYSAEDFHRNSAVLMSSLVNNPHLQVFAYPLMLAYDILKGERSDDPLPVESFLKNYTTKVFLASLQDIDVQSHLKTLFPAQEDLIPLLEQRAKKVKFVFLDRFVRIAAIILMYNCTSLAECPPVARALDSALHFWISHFAPRCLIARAMYLTNRTYNMASHQELIHRRNLTLPPQTISIMYSPPYITELIGRVRDYVESANLSDEHLERSVYFCNTTDPAPWPVRNTVVLSIQLYQLFWRSERTAESDGIARFALVLAEAPSVKSAICTVKTILPDPECEVRLFLAFNAFMPPPNDLEVKFTGTADKTMVYFILRAVMRLQVRYGARLYKGKDCHECAATEVLEAAEMFVEHCVQLV